MSTTTYAVTGMTCEHCVAAVTQELSSVEGVTDVAVALVPHGTSHVTVTSPAEPPLDAVESAVAEAGYTLEGPIS
ncbi:heavy-metal-associated domain-containing protein [Aeromicrobium sp.]|uniref:heavy-metal-associated domain-containing protein n=1 Tax=Aeromicrobium sp. TaxID=1871063 RepID=UPI00403484C9